VTYLAPTEGDLTVTTVGGAMVMSINRPDQRNAMTLQAAVLIAAALTELDDNPALRVGVLTGTGRDFCSGMDLKRFHQGERPYVPGRGFGGLVEAPPTKPLIAAVEGWALGGGFELVLACDLVVAGASVRFGFPEVQRGLVARGGGMFRLAQRIPRSIALEVLLSGEPLGATSALQHGLVNRLVDDGQALVEALSLAEKISTNAPLAVTKTKEIEALTRGMSDVDAFAHQRPLSDAVFASHDAREGVIAYKERRLPFWRGR
jgi:enoyl-CoA hydratase